MLSSGRRNIVLCGFMGTGKSTVSRELARLTGYRTLDVDTEIERTAGMRISEIFEREGEEGFRRRESGEIVNAAEQDRVIISTGGGAVTRQENIDALRRTGVLVCLGATVETILKRTSRNKDRPLLNVPDPEARIRGLLEARAEHYAKADCTVQTDGKSPFAIANEILEAMGWKN